jgi:hypothetical protein
MRQKLNVVDTSGLTDVDWAVVNRVNRAYEAEGIEAFWDELSLEDSVQAITVASAFFPDLVREVKDHMAEHGVTIDDLREILRTSENHDRYQ